MIVVAASHPQFCAVCGGQRVVAARLMPGVPSAPVRPHLCPHCTPAPQAAPIPYLIRPRRTP